MVPGHPPCALCSLIFSSLDPETNCFSYQPSFRSSRSFRPACNWPFMNLFRFRCAVVKVRVDRALKTIQNNFVCRKFSRLPFRYSLQRSSGNAVVTSLTFSLRIQLAIYVAFPPNSLPFPSGQVPPSVRPGISFRVPTSAFSLERR